jgi:hypothetical protein
MFYTYNGYAKLFFIIPNVFYDINALLILWRYINENLLPLHTQF